MDEIYDNNQMNQPIESEKIFTLKRKDFDEDKYKSPNKIMQKKHENNNEESALNKGNHILNINYILKEKAVYESNNMFMEKRNENSSNNKEDSPSVKLFRKNSSNNKSKDSLNYNKLKNDLIPNLENAYTPEKNRKSQKNLRMSLVELKPGKNDMIISLYKDHINFVKKKNIFIILFSFGILFSMINLFLSIALTLYGNIEIFAIFIVVNLFLIFFFALGIYFIEKNKIYTYNIISEKNSPEKIENSEYKNNIYLLLYFLLFGLSYYLAIMFGLSFYKNNIKLDIKSRAYDKTKWRFYFQNKSFDKVLKVYEQINKVIMVFGWLAVCILIISISLFIHFFSSYQFWKRIFQSISFLFGQISFLLLNVSSYCFQFRNITLLDEYKLNWVELGLIFVGIFGIIISAFYFYMFYTENIKYFKFFNYFGLLIIILSMVFTGGAKAFGLKFDDYKKASCNNLFKFISEDYLVKNKDCNQKYLFSQNNLEDIQCPKERIMINWEKTEEKIKNGNILDNDYPVYGCINQYCCLKIYGKLKNGFNIQEILAFNQLFLYIILYFSGRYIKNRIGKLLEEEIIEKFNLLTLVAFNLIIYIICFIIILSRPPTSKQNILNDIETQPIASQYSFLDKNLILLSDKNKLIEQTKNLWNELINNNFMEYTFDIIENNNDFNFEYFEYNISSNNLLIEKIIRDEDKNNEELIDYKVDKCDDNKTDIINFKSKKLLINSLNKYFKFQQSYIFQPENSLIISCNMIYSTEKDDTYIKNQISKINEDSSPEIINDDKIEISNNLILLNYNLSLGKSIIQIFSNQSFPILNINKIINNNKTNITFFYIKGNVLNDSGFSSINIYNKIDNLNNLIYNGKTNTKGEFSIGPFYIYKNTALIFELIIEIFKININEDNNTITHDENYTNYTKTIKIGGYGYNINNSFNQLTNIILPLKTNKEYYINGLVYKCSDNSALESVSVYLYKGNTNIEENNNNDEINLINKIITNKHGIYNFKIKENGQYTLIFEKADYFSEKYNFIVTNNTNVKIKDIGMIQLFNSGKIVVKMEWENNPPDLDLYCRFKAKDNNFCYTFFGNNKCVDTNYPYDNKKGGNNGSEIIEVEILGEYNYFFYVRKYFDVSNNIAKNERKINDFENDNNNISLYYKENDELISNSKVKLSLYANGIKTPALILNIPNPVEYNLNNNYIYWGGFCLKSKKGLEGINIINEFYVDEPPKNVCSN